MVGLTGLPNLFRIKKFSNLFLFQKHVTIAIKPLAYRFALLELLLKHLMA